MPSTVPIAVPITLAVGFLAAFTTALAATCWAARYRRLAGAWMVRCDRRDREIAHRDRVIRSAFARKCGPPIDPATVGRIAEALRSPSETIYRAVR